MHLRDRGEPPGPRDRAVHQQDRDRRRNHDVPAAVEGAGSAVGTPVGMKIDVPRLGSVEWTSGGAGERVVDTSSALRKFLES